MKTQRTLFLRLLPLAALLLPATAQLPARTNAVQPGLTAERTGDNLILRWTGGDNIRLQTSACLCGSAWQDVPDPETNCTVVVTMTEPAAFFRLVDANADTDEDFLTRGEEEAGWTIFVDTSGYGDPRIVEQRHVTSDPELADTDGDGLDDFWEWIVGTDPRATDTDRDGLSDSEEWFRWLTSPTSVDTDGDARGPNQNLPPSATLFDGNELRLLHTSPTLDDTDGDGRTDYEEYDQPGRNLLVAEVPRLDVQLVDEVDIRLDVQYAEETGKTFEYGSELSESTTTSDSYSQEDSVQVGLKWGAEISAGPLGFLKGARLHTEWSVGYGHVWSATRETAASMQNSYSQYSTDSRTRTETAASGSMSAGIRLANTGPITYTLRDFGLTVRYWLPGGTSGTKAEFKTLATLIPVLGANGITLAPGDSTPVLQVQATGLNASRVREFMARPNSLHLESAYYELENALGLNFDFLEEVTRWRTARVGIDYGDGRNETYRVATNVERNEDGSYAGITLGNVLSNILRIPFQTIPRQVLQPTNATHERVLYSVREVATISTTNGFWVVALSAETTPQLPPHFEDLVLQAGDEVLLTFVRDEDEDGLFAAEEQHYRTDDRTTADSDGDGLTDVFEARTGWEVVLLARSYHVYSDPAQVDQDGDGLTDLVEFQKGTDPARPDTDADGVADGLDAHPLMPAKVLRVKADGAGGDGSTWALALSDLQAALTQARNGLATTANPADDVAEIWVAAGVYKPTTTTNDRTATFELVNNTALYGGFTGVESKLSQRNSDPLFNGTVLSGDLWNNDASTYGENTNSFADNSAHVCFAPLATAVGPGTVLDGFTITGGNDSWEFGTGGGLECFGNPRLRNLLFRANHAGYFGGGLALRGLDREVVVSDCLFLQNSAEQRGGGMSYSPFTSSSASRLVLTNCQFIQNETRKSGFATNLLGGAGLTTAGGAVLIEDCTFSLNTSSSHGGGIYFPPNSGSTARISKSQFRQNVSAREGGGISTFTPPGAATNYPSVEVVQSVFWGNEAGATFGGGAISVASPGTSLYVLGSTFTTNKSGAAAGGGAIALGSGLTPAARVQGLVENSILWGNTLTPNITLYTPSGSSVRVRTSCLPEASSYPGAGNINADPKFEDKDGGNLRLQSGSPCIDRGNNYLDYYPTVPGFQLLPATDLDGNGRIVDGNTDGTATVDMGAYERQGP